MEELDEIFDETKKVVKVKSYWNEPLPGGKMPVVHVTKMLRALRS